VTAPPVRLLAALLLVAGGWHALTRDGAGDAASLPTRYVEGVAGQPARVHPLYASANPVDADLAMLVFSGLMQAGPDGLPQLDLAERWDVTPDGLRYTFVLRDGLHWHDGEPLTSADVAFTIATVQAPEFDGQPTLALEWRDVAVETPDAQTIVFTLPAPAAGFLNRAAIGIAPRHLLEGGEGGDSRFSAFLARPVGSGPYRVMDLDEERAVLERNASYHLGAPAIDEFELRFHSSEAAVANALANGDLDGALLSQYARDSAAQALATRPDLAPTGLTLAEFDVLYLNLRREPLGNEALRRAIAAAVQPSTVTQAAGVAGLPGEGPFVPGSWAYSPRQPAEADAPALFDEAGWPRGEGGLRRRDGQALALELVTNADPLRAALAAEMARRLQVAGLEVTVTTLPAGQLVAERLRPGEFDLFGWDAGDDPDPYGGWHSSQMAPDGANVGGYGDPRADAVLALARLTLDIPERRGLYERFNDLFAETVPGIVVRYPTATYVRPTALKTPPPGLLFTTAHRFADVHLWRIEP
jgi:peptide/nickel transport system substrate-binding protein